MNEGCVDRVYGTVGILLINDHTDLDLAGGDHLDIDLIFRQSLEHFGGHPKVALGAAFNSRVHIVGRYLERSGRQLRSILGYDLLPKNVSCLKRGTVEYLIGQRPGLQGYYGILALCDHMVFKQPVPPLKYMPIDLLMKENIDYYFEMHT